MSSSGPKVGQKKKFELPHIFAILFAIIIICTILTWIIPAGTFDYVENEDGRNIAVAGTWHPVDDVDPVGPFRMLGLVYEGMIDAADIIFLIFITYASTTFIIKSGAFDGLVGFLLKIFKGNSSVITIPVFLIALGAGSSTVGMCEEWYPFVPVFVTLYMGMGYDAMVGLGVVALAACCGYAGAFMNPFTVGVAQGIAELPYMSGALYRILCHAIFIIIASFFLMRYASKVKNDPTQSVLYGTDLAPVDTSEMDIEHLQFTTRQKLVLLDLVVAVAVIVFGVFKFGWYLSEICAIFLLMAFIAAIIMKWNINKVGEMFAAGVTDAAVAATMYVASGTAAGISIKRLSGDENTQKLPTMAVASALVFAGSQCCSSRPSSTSSYLPVQVRLQYPCLSWLLLPTFLAYRDRLRYSLISSVMVFRTPTGLPQISLSWQVLQESNSTSTTRHSPNASCASS